MQIYTPRVIGESEHRRVGSCNDKPIGVVRINGRTGCCPGPEAEDLRQLLALLDKTQMTAQPYVGTSHMAVADFRRTGGHDDIREGRDRHDLARGRDHRVIADVLRALAHLQARIAFQHQVDALGSDGDLRHAQAVVEGVHGQGEIRGRQPRIGQPQTVGDQTHLGRAKLEPGDGPELVAFRARQELRDGARRLSRDRQDVKQLKKELEQKK